jgi:hypothetical protein
MSADAPPPSPSPQDAKLTAEAAKFVAEARKVEAETAALNRSTLSTVSEWIKIVGGIILGLGGVVAAVTQYQLSEVKKENAELAVRFAEQNRDRVERQTSDMRNALAEHRERVLLSLAEIQEEPYGFADIESPEHRWIKVLRRLETDGGASVWRTGRITVERRAEEYASWLTSKMLKVARTTQEAQVAARLINETTSPTTRTGFEQLFLDAAIEASNRPDWRSTVTEMARGTADAVAPAFALQVRPAAGQWLQHVRYVRYEFYSSKQDEGNDRALAAHVAINSGSAFQLFLFHPEWRNVYVKYTAVTDTGEIVATGYGQLKSDEPN